MNIDEMTIGEARQIQSFIGGSRPCPFAVGSAYLIRTITMAWTGRVREIVGDFLVLDEAAWIADIGRYHKATTTSELSEVEPAGNGIFVGLASIVDARPWTEPLPIKAK